MLYSKMMKIDTAKHSLVLLLTFFLTLLWVNNPLLSRYSLQLAAGLIIFMIISHKIFSSSQFLLTESTISVTSIVLVTSVTGGIASPFFYLNHFLLFELSFFLKPSVSLILTLGLMVFYIYSRQVGTSLYNLLFILSFIFVTPLAYLTRKVYQKAKKQITINF